ncbi:MAG: metallophosphoesterase [Intestinibaculum porci]|uniref:metallophosphoesterase n=1 Tax=Intestinibaculum porci TaxID=2487118 RepID=UPI00240A6F93|nr:metallophosphoesterase [Intestinibaculum porci]MDD6423399.1 metallophosphoesterase [Intestinibaculum porci]
MARKFKLRKRVYVLFAGIIALILVINVIYVAAFSKTAYTFSQENVASTSIPKDFDGFKVAMISDVHLKTEADLTRLTQILKELSTKDIDLALFGGDLYYSKIFSSEKTIQALKSVEAPYGKFAVLGDEDESQGKEVTALLNDGGFEVLNNEERPIYYKDKEIDLYGLSTTPQASLLHSANYSIVLTHYPDSFTTIAGHTSLQLSGHSGGGYLTFPLIGSLIKVKHAKTYTHGTYTKKKSTLLISNGVAPSPLYPYKFGAKNEVQIITFTYGH